MSDPNDVVAGAAALQGSKIPLEDFERICKQIEGKPLIKVVEELYMLEQARKLVDWQANDEGLWFIPKYSTEFYLQSELRKLHEIVEGKTSEECARAALKER